MKTIAGIKNSTEIYRNLSYEEIFKHEMKEGITVLTSQDAMAVDTGIYTGRSPKDKYIVQEPYCMENVWWGAINQPVSEEVFDELYGKVQSYMEGRPLYVFDGFAGARRSTRMNLRIITERAWQHHFCTNMFIRPGKEELNSLEPEFTIINASGLKNPDYKRHGLNSDVFVMFHLSRKIAIIGGTEYGGEMKKGIFSVMNYYKPLEGILTMHCSANQGKGKGDTALFFGLSGTGKTTLSTDPRRAMIGDDEHGWDDDGIWNLEGGCYAKTVNLTLEDEPEIYKAIKRDALLENVVLREDKSVDYANTSKTENTRVSYPIEHLKNRTQPSTGGHPVNIIFLTCDAFGVLPPVARLTPEQAMYHFLSGYTAKIAGTERGVTEPSATFSACFGAAFMMLHPTRYAKLLGEKIKKHNVKAYLVNTGWAGGPYGVGKRMKIKFTRGIINHIFDGSMEHDDFIKDEVLNLSIPNHLGDFDSSILHPWKSWSNQGEYETQRKKLASMFIKNFQQYADGGEFDYSKYGPRSE